jgi:hypothetical protein
MGGLETTFLLGEVPMRMFYWSLVLLSVFVTAAFVVGAGRDTPAGTQPPKPFIKPPKGFITLFNGTDLTGWNGTPQFDPAKLAALPEAERKTRLEGWNAELKNHWTVDAGLLVNVGNDACLSTDKDYGDVELLLEYKIAPRTDGGISLRGTPQVQIWDTTKEGGQGDKGADKGSGGLTKNGKDAPGRNPLERADKALGEWNSLRILQVGERTTVYLNGKLVVDHARMANAWNAQAALPRQGPIQLAVKTGEIRWRNLFVREIPSPEANEILRKHGADGFVDVFNGKDFTGWAGPIDQYEVKEGAIVCLPKKGGTIYTQAEYSDFLARVEFKLPPAGNNGLAIRYPGKGDTAYVGMCEIQVLDDTAAMYAKLDPRQYNGSVYGIVAAQRGYLRPVGEWNFDDVTIQGSTIKVELNGTVIVDADVSKVTEYMGNRAHPGKDRKSGYFGFAGHNDPVAFRNIQIKVLETK